MTILRKITTIPTTTIPQQQQQLFFSSFFLLLPQQQERKQLCGSSSLYPRPHSKYVERGHPNHPIHSIPMRSCRWTSHHHIHRTSLQQRWYSTGHVMATPHVTLEHQMRPSSTTMNHTNNDDNNNTNNDSSVKNASGTPTTSLQTDRTVKYEGEADGEASVVVETHPPIIISILTLNRPAAANAIGYTMLHQLQGCIRELEHSNCTSRCVIVTSCSDTIFSAGADLKERAQMTCLTEVSDFVTLLRTTLDQFSQLPIPTIAAIEGIAVGGGLELALATDLRIVSDTSQLGCPETTLGIVPGAGGTQRLSRLIGPARAKELIWTGRRISATTALSYGLVQHVVPSGTVMDAAYQMAWTIADNGPVAVQAAKVAIDEGLFAKDMTEALAIEGRAYDRVLSTKDRLEGLLAFKEQRKPQYNGY
jgi:methylglutaconyl-CoA hydratase